MSEGSLTFFRRISEDATSTLTLAGSLGIFCGHMYAVIETGGKQYRVTPGDVIQIEKLEGEVGAQIKFDHVLMVNQGDPENAQITLGKPYLAGANVAAEVVGQGRGDKILIIKMKRRKQYRRTQGHRQNYTQVIVTGIDSGNGKTHSLSDSDKKTKLSKFQSHLKPKGEAFARRPLTKARAKKTA